MLIGYATVWLFFALLSQDGAGECEKMTIESLINTIYSDWRIVALDFLKLR